MAAAGVSAQEGADALVQHDHESDRSSGNLDPSEDVADVPARNRFVRIVSGGSVIGEDDGEWTRRSTLGSRFMVSELFSEDTSEEGDSSMAQEEPPMEAASGPRHSKHFVRRLLDRDAPSHQSKGMFNVRHYNQSAYLLYGDLFHVIIHLPLWGLLLLFAIVYVSSWLLFAVLWWYISEPCDIGLDSYLSAFYLSIETQMTIGYGVPDPNFGGCPQGVFVLTSQALIGLVIDAIMIGVVFQQTTSAYTRASTIIFSNHAVLQVIDGCVHLIFRVAEMQKQPLLQAVMQVYCVQHHVEGRTPGGVRVEVSAVQLKEPDTDTYNGVLFLGLPTMVVHRIDYASPLSPPRTAKADQEEEEGASDYPSPEAVKAYLWQRPYLEVLVLLSGTEDATASSIEARHSYTLDDIFWNRAFCSCVSIDAQGHHCINFANMHTTVAMWEPLSTAVADRDSTPGGLPPKNIHSRRSVHATYEENSDSDSDS